jgi:DNA-binding MarR family transcriptional regulator
METEDTTEKLPYVDEYYKLWLLLSQTRSAIFKARHKKVGKYVHFNQGAALMTIWTGNGRVTPAVLARHLFLEPHSVSELIIRMEKKGLVKKNRDKQKENVVRLSLTEKGRRFCRETVQEDFIRGIMSSLTARQRRQLRSYLTVLLRKAMDKLGKDEPLPLPPETPDDTYL